jgi:hypothetical protein
MSLQEAADALTVTRMKDVRDRLERVLCAFFIHARFTSGRYTLAPPVPPSEGFAGALELTEFSVSTDHVRLLQQTDWRGPTINTKRPYGRAVYCEVDIARVLGIPIPELHDGESLPSELQSRLEALHHDLLFVLQAYLQHAELEPGRYRVPFDGWDLVRPRCQPPTQVRLDAYVRGWEQLRQRKFQNNSDAVVPVMRAAQLLLQLD